jgi:hypothetical protein
LPTAARYAAELAGDQARAAELWAGLGCPYDAALALVDADDDDALRRALDELQRLGAQPAAAIVARRLRARGEIRARTKAGARFGTTRNYVTCSASHLPGKLQTLRIRPLR